MFAIKCPGETRKPEPSFRRIASVAVPSKGTEKKSVEPRWHTEDLLYTVTS
jgi:hypothetical protein